MINYIEINSEMTLNLFKMDSHKVNNIEKNSEQPNSATVFLTLDNNSLNTQSTENNTNKIDVDLYISLDQWDLVILYDILSGKLFL